MEDEDAFDIRYWQCKSVSERLSEVVRLRRIYYTWLNGSFPEKIEKVVSTRQMNIENL